MKNSVSVHVTFISTRQKTVSFHTSLMITRSLNMKALQNWSIQSKRDVATGPWYKVSPTYIQQKLFMDIYIYNTQMSYVALYVKLVSL